MKRLVLLNPVGTIGGAERVLLSVARQVREKRSDLAIVAVLLGDGPLKNALEQCGVEVHLLPLPEAAAELGDTKLRGQNRLIALASLAQSGFANSLGLLRYSRRLRTLLNSLHPILIHSNGLKTHLLAAFATPPGVPVIWHVHDFYSQRPLMAKLLRRLGDPARAIVISNAVKADFAAVLPAVPATLIYNAIDISKYAPAAGDPAALDALAGLPTLPGIIRIGLVATYANWKGHDLFLQAAARIPRADIVRFFIIGGPIYRTLGSQFSLGELQSLAESLGLADRVGFVPFQADPANVYRALDIVVHASTRPEPFGLTIAEAMACGRAVIVSAGGGACELFSDGVDAIGHIPGNVDSLVDAIKKFIDDPELRRRLGENARRTALERFGEEPFARALLSLYSECLALPR